MASRSASKTSCAGRSGALRARSLRRSKRTASGDNKPEPPDQTVSALHLTFFETAPGFETLVIVFHDPAVLIPPDALPGLLERRRGNRGHQKPFQRLFSGGSLLFPDPDGPHPHRLFAAAFLEARRQHGQRAKGELHDGRASRSSMTAWHVKRSAGYRWPSSHRTLADAFAVPLLARCVDSQTLAPENGSAWLDRPERTETYRRRDLRHAQPWSQRESAPSRVTRRIHTSVSRSLRCRRLLRVSPAGAGVRTKGSCIAQPNTSPLCGRTASTVCRYSPRPRSLPRLSQAFGFGMMAQVHLGGVQNPQHNGSGLNLFARLLPMRLHQCLKGHILFIRASGTRPSSLSRSAFGRARRPKHCGPCAWPLSPLALFAEYP
jgi:hypothetical protein